MDRLATLAASPERATAEGVRAAVVDAVPAASGDPARRAAIVAALDPLLSRFPDAVVAALPAPFLADLLADGYDDLVVRVVERAAAVASFAAAEALGDQLVGRSDGSDSVPVDVLVALARATACSNAALAARLVDRARVDAASAGVAADAVVEVEALLRAVDDVPAAESAARRALARIAVERAWKPDAWGRDHGALVSIVTRRLKGDSASFGGPLITYLRSTAPDEVARIAKRVGARAGPAGSWFARGSAPASAAPGSMPEPDANEGRGAYLETLREAAAAERERLRLRAAPPARGVGASPAAASRAPRAPVRDGSAVGGIHAGTWWFPILASGLVLALVLAKVLRWF